MSLSASPLIPTAGFTYYIEAVHQEVWPSCPYRFLSYPSTCSSVDMYNNVGGNQEWKFLDAGGGNFYLKSSCGSFLSYSDNCDVHVLDQWPAAGVNQQFALISDGSAQFEYFIEAVGRKGCDFKYASFPQACTTSSSDTIDLWSGAGQNQRFRIFPVRSDSPSTISPGADTACADPFAYYDVVSGSYYMHCTGGDLNLLNSTLLNTHTVFSNLGMSLGGDKPSWAANGDRWAPENFQSGSMNFLHFGDSQNTENGVHRIGYSVSSTGVHANAWDSYSSSYLPLANTDGGEIDSNMFLDEASGNVYIVYKSDDNNSGSSTTRIWIQQVAVSESDGTISVVGEPTVILDSTGLWWVDSWINGGSLIEGPELIKPTGSSYYYLYFAAGKYCQDSYSEGVARSESLFGPYEKMGVPLLSTGMVGNGPSGAKIVGPGHASFLQGDNGEWFAIWHASIGENCDRYPFISHISIGSDGWPFVNFTSM